MSKESDQHRNYLASSEADVLPPELADFLRSIQLGVVFESTDLGAALIIKAPHREIDGLRGLVPIHLVHELHRLPTAPVIRTVVRLYDRPNSSLVLETMTNIDDPVQRAEFAALESQETIYLHFYDEELRRCLTKCVGYNGSEVPRLLRLADEFLRTITPERVDFDLAKQQVLANTYL